MMKKLVCSFCVDMLMENYQSDHNNYTAVTFVNAVNRGKLINASRATLLIVQHLEKAFQVIVVQKSQLHKNVEHNIVVCARKSIQLKSSLFFFPGSHPINVDLGAPSHEYMLSKLILKHL
ncbi:THAP domain-containing protein 9 [Aphis craccivora]|uniref:THAP domain-containing protein 9 n=1 Tax=Aphis craccivora TaxID=307492 RepID=A0A6G0Y161_APHCR|nr:THAP domain-containing protein 9 [Aphis craccivora]